MKVSIVTPSYNQGNFLRETINSVLECGYPDLEYIIMDGKSTDNSVEVIQSFGERINYWESEKDRGQSHAINKGLQRAKGEIVAWLNSDDLYEKGAISRIVEAFEANPGVEVIYGDVLNFSDDGESQLWVNPEFDKVTFLRKVGIHQPAVFWRRKVHEEVGFLDEKLFYTMDYDLWVRLFYRYRSLHIPFTIARFRVHPGAKTFKSPPGLYLDHRKVLSRFFATLGNTQLISRLRNLGLYDNPDNTKYPFSLSLNEEQINRIVEDYLLNGLEQEYTFGSISKANTLAVKCMKGTYRRKALFYLLKNQLRFLRRNQS